MGIKKHVKPGRVIQPIKGHCPTTKASNEPEFKPGETPSLEYEGEVLNGNVNWVQTTKAVLSHGYTKSHLAHQLELTINHVESILKGDLTVLNFKRGARLLAIEDALHCAK